LPPAAGAGLHPDADVAGGDDVSQRARPADDEAGVHGQGAAREAPAEGAAALLGSGAARAGARGARAGAAHRSDRQPPRLPRAAGPAPPAAATGKASAPRSLMATYAIGDVQGCYATFERFLARVGFGD